jgi:alpha-galactosidase
MKPTTINAQATQAETDKIIHGEQITIQFDAQPLQFYRHGWQSWSLAAWVDPAQRVPAIRPKLLHPMQTDPRYASESQPNGSWLGAVELSDGNILLLGALGLEAHVTLSGNSLKGWYESGEGDWFVGRGPEQWAFAHYTTLLEERLGKGRSMPSPRVWCSWYSLYTSIDESILFRTLNELGSLPFDVFQVDDGWQVGIGDWQPNDKFPSGMEALADRIRASGRTPGLWLAPLLVVPSSKLFREHPDWLLRNEKGQLVSAGFNWGEQLYTIDTTHPEVLEWLTNLMKRVRAWGFDYIKLDFLYAGALPGRRRNGLPRETAYRHGLQVIREALGDAYFLTCGAPILPSLGLCDAMRIGPDVAHYWDSMRDSRMLNNPTTPGVKNAIRTSLNRLWLNPLVQTDPDVVYFRSKLNELSDQQKRLLQDLALICDFNATSDLPSWLNESERARLSDFLTSHPMIKRTERYKFTIDKRNVDFSEAIPLSKPLNLPLRSVGAILGWAANFPVIMRANDRLGKWALTKLRKDHT